MIKALKNLKPDAKAKDVLRSDESRCLVLRYRQYPAGYPTPICKASVRPSYPAEYLSAQEVRQLYNSGESFEYIKFSNGEEITARVRV